MLRGTVFDSIAMRPLRAASVQFRPQDMRIGRVYSATTDDSGRYSIQLPTGRFVAGFNHPFHDSLGIELSPVDVLVSDAKSEVNLASPSARTLVRTLCPGATDTTTTGLLLGHVHDAVGLGAMDSVVIVVGWIEWESRNARVFESERRITATTSADGWFGVCSIPSGTPLVITAGDSIHHTGSLTLQLESGEVRHLNLFIGQATRVPADSSTQKTLGIESWWRGSNRISGRVVDLQGDGVSGATVAVPEAGVEATTSATGGFRLENLPPGSWMLTARKPGYDPGNAIAPITSQDADVVITVTTAANQLDAVEVRTTSPEVRLVGFRERMNEAEKGALHGHFITRADIERRGSTLVTNLLEGLTGVRVEKHPNSGSFLKRVVYGTNRCRMTVYLDEIRILPKLSGKTSEELNELVSSTDLAGIEVYPSMAGAPPKYQSLNGTCGVVLLWSR